MRARVPADRPAPRPAPGACPTGPASAYFRPVIDRIQDTALRIARATLHAFARPAGKLGRGLAGRREAVRRMETWAATDRVATRPLVWFHAPSAGEALMAGAIIRALRTRRPDLQIAFTWFSPSAERVAGQVGADVTAYLPWDIRRDVNRALDALRPQVIAFVRTEVWPALTREAKRRGVRLTLVNAPLAAGSSRLGGIGRAVLGPAYRALDAIGAVGPTDARRFARFGVDPGRVHVTGDARFDQVVARLGAMTGGSSASITSPGRPCIVAGSIWDADAEHVVPAIAALRAQGPLTWYLVPHEPVPARIAYLEGVLGRHGLRDEGEGEGEFPGEGEREEGEGVRVHIIRRVGVLAGLYRLARVAYVGGGFGRDGLHSVIEPAAVGVPVVFGPRHGNTVEAEALVEAGGGYVVRSADEVVSRITALLSDPGPGAAAAAFVQRRLGGAEANAALIEALLAEAGAA